MGREMLVRKARQCKCCEASIYVTAPELVEHSKLCKIAKKLGIILVGGPIVPDFSEIVLTNV